MAPWKKWLYGLVAGAVGAGAQGVIGALGVGAANLAGLKVPLLDLKQIGIVFASGALVSGFMYLQKSPLPPMEEEVKPPDPKP